MSDRFKNIKVHVFRFYSCRGDWKAKNSSCLEPITHQRSRVNLRARYAANSSSPGPVDITTWQSIQASTKCTARCATKVL